MPNSLKKDLRKHNRISRIGRVFIAWEDPQGCIQYAQAQCLEVSEGGLRISAPQPIPVRSRISLRGDEIDLFGTAIVRHSTRKGFKYILGLELAQPMSDKASASIREQIAARALLASNG